MVEDYYMWKSWSTCSPKPSKGVQGKTLWEAGQSEAPTSDSIATFLAKPTLAQQWPHSASLIWILSRALGGLARGCFPASECHALRENSGRARRNSRCSKPRPFQCKWGSLLPTQGLAAKSGPKAWCLRQVSLPNTHIIYFALVTKSDSWKVLTVSGLCGTRKNRKTDCRKHQ